jgi:hypothetical protein
VTGNGIPRVKIGLGKLSRNTQSGKGCKGQWYLIWVQMFAGQISSDKRLGTVVNETRSTAGTNLYRIFFSTDKRSGIDPVYGAPGVDSSIYRPYSGWNLGTTTLC